MVKWVAVRVSKPVFKPQTAFCLKVVFSVIYLLPPSFRLQNQRIDNRDLSDSPKPEKLVYEDLEEHVSPLECKF